VIRDKALRRFAGGFTAVPNVVLRNSDLSIGAKMAYAMLLSYAWQEEQTFAAQRTMARDLGCAARSIRRWLNELKEQGFVDWEQRGFNRPNTYYIQKLPTAAEAKPCRTSHAPSGPDNISAPDRTAEGGGQIVRTGADMKSEPGGTNLPTTKTQIEKTQTHTLRVPSEIAEEVLSLLHRFHAESGRTANGRKPHPKEVAFASELIAEHGVAKAAHVVEFGLAQAAATNFSAQYLHAYQGYVPDALRDFERREALAKADRAAAEQRKLERRQELAQQQAHFAKPLEERVEHSLSLWIEITERLERRKLDSEEIEQKRNAYRTAEIANEQEFAADGAHAQ